MHGVGCGFVYTIHSMRSMDYRSYDNAAAFLDVAGELLFAEEAKYSLLLGVALHCRDSPLAAAADPCFGVLHHAARPRIAVLQTPPHAVQVTEGNEAELDSIVEALLARGCQLPGIVAVSDVARTFGQAWCRATGLRLRPHMAQGLYRIDRVAAVPDVPGRLRPGLEAEQETIRQWMRAFARDCRIPQAEPLPQRIKQLDEGRLFVWEHENEARSMACWARPTANGVSIGYVYTPDDLRGRGYASALLAALTQKMLDDGKKFCCLFTDLANPISNRIYQRIGYRRVCDYRHDLFVAP